MAASVNTGCAITNHRMRDVDARIAAHAIASPQPKCNDGIAANWLANPWYGLPLPYDAGPTIRPVSTNPRWGNMRGGASGHNKWSASPTNVIRTITLRKRTYVRGCRA